MTIEDADVSVLDAVDASLDWYTRFFGRPPDLRAGDEILWDVDEHATLFIEPNAAQHAVIAGARHLAPLEQPEAFREVLLGFL